MARHVLWGIRFTLPLVVLAACGQVDPVAMPVSMPECIYQGPSSMVAGNARVSLQLNGISDSGAVLVELIDERTYADLVDHLGNEARWTEIPAWVSTRLDLRIDPNDSADGVDETLHLDEGTYAMVCLDYPYDESAPLARAAGPIEVSAG